MNVFLVCGIPRPLDCLANLNSSPFFPAFNRLLKLSFIKYQISINVIVSTFGFCVSTDRSKEHDDSSFRSSLNVHHSVSYLLVIYNFTLQKNIGNRVKMKPSLKCQLTV